MWDENLISNKPSQCRNTNYWEDIFSMKRVQGLLNNCNQARFMELFSLYICTINTKGNGMAYYKSVMILLCFDFRKFHQNNTDIPPSNQSKRLILFLNFFDCIGVFDIVIIEIHNKERFGDTKTVIKGRKSKNRQYKLKQKNDKKTALQTQKEK